jgi:hypothetical protein
VRPDGRLPFTFFTGARTDLYRNYIIITLGEKTRAQGIFYKKNWGAQTGTYTAPPGEAFYASVLKISPLYEKQYKDPPYQIKGMPLIFRAQHSVPLPFTKSIENALMASAHYPPNRKKLKDKGGPAGPPPQKN